MRRTRWATGVGAGLLALLAVPAAALADGNTLQNVANDGKFPARRRHQLRLGARRRHPRDVHAGGLRLPGDRLLPRQERGHGGREDPGQLLDLRRSASTPSASPSRSATGNQIIGTHGFFLAGADAGANFPLAWSGRIHRHVTVETLWFFQFVFCAVSLAIVWGTTLERIKFGVYIIYAIVFSALIYPIGAHWIFGGGWLATKFGMQDFAGSTVVHLIGATGALAALLLLGPRRGKYGADGKPRAIPGHNMPLFGLGILILWLGWFGFNPGSGLQAMDGRFPEIAMVTNLAAAAGVISAVAVMYLKVKKIDIGMAGNGAIAAPGGHHRPVGLRRAVGRADHRRGRRRDRRARRARDRQVDRRPGGCAVRARPGRHLGHDLLRPVHGAAAGRLQRGRRSRPRLQRLVPPAVRPDPRRRCRPSRSSSSLSFATFFAIKKTYGLRVSAEEEDAGLDISEHGMYGYPEQFIPAPELVGYAPAATPVGPARTPAASTREVPA